MPASHKPAPQNADDNLDDFGRDLRTGKTRDEQHPQQEFEIGRQNPREDQPAPAGKPTDRRG